MEALIDGDIIAYRCSAVSEQEQEEVVSLWRIDDSINLILKDTQASHYKIFMSPSITFRHELSPLYKANRKDKPKPKYLARCKEYLALEWKAKVGEYVEADDLLGINQTKDTIICSIDKDLKQIPGNHYNFVKGEFTSVSEFQGLKNFYTQLLVGDVSDNIIGIRGIGPKKAEAWLEGCTTEDDLFTIVRELYNDDARMYLNGKLLWILREEDKIWTNQTLEKSLISINQLKQEEEVQLNLLNSLMMNQQINQSLEDTNLLLDGSPVHGLKKDSSD